MKLLKHTFNLTIRIFVQVFPSLSVSPSSVVKNVFHTEMIQIKDVDVQLKMGNTTWQKILTAGLKVPCISAALLKRVGGVVVSIAAFQAVDRCSIPGRRI